MTNIFKIFLTLSSLLFMLGISQSTLAQSKTVIQETYNPILGTPPKTIVIIGDGFQASEQKNFNDYVNVQFMASLYTGGFAERLDSFRIVRVNVNSKDSGVTQTTITYKHGAKIKKITTKRDTVLKWQYTGSWNSCWAIRSKDTKKITSGILKKLKINANYTVTVLNEKGLAGCASGNQFVVSLGTSNSVISHELGHMLGDLADEYGANKTKSYTGAEPGRVNITTRISATTLKWREWYDKKNTSLPTKGLDVANIFEEIGAFLGGNARFNSGIWRPSFDGRMNNNRDRFNAPSYDALMKIHAIEELPAYGKVHIGDFNGDGRDDVLLQRNNALIAYQTTREGSITWLATVVDKIEPDSTLAKVGWNDTLIIGDFDGDGHDEIGLSNSTDSKYRGFTVIEWDSTSRSFRLVSHSRRSIGHDPMKPVSRHDQLFALDINGDGRDDIAVFNGKDYRRKALALYTSKSNGDFRPTKIFADKLPNWKMSSGDQFLVGDFDGDGKEELSVYNVKNWKHGYVGIFRSDSRTLKLVRRYDVRFENWKKLKRHDKIQIGDFNNDGKSDFLITNVAQKYWCCEYLAIQTSNGNGVDYKVKYTNSVPGWVMSAGDRFYISDHDNDGDDDIIVFNATSWKTEHLGIIIVQNSSKMKLRTQDQTDWIGRWNLREDDKLLIANIDKNKSGIIIYNDNWLGNLGASEAGFEQLSIHPQYIKDYPYHKNGWW